MILYGASGHAKVIIEILEDASVTIDGLFDDNPEISELCGYNCSVFNQSEIGDKQMIISIGDNRIRKSVRERIGDVKFGVAADIRATLSKRAIIGEGSVFMPGATVNSCSVIGKHVIINTNASIDHDCKIGDYVHISPGCSVAGGVSIGEGTHAGTGASIIPGIKIGKWYVIGAGAVIIHDIPDYSVVVGNPGRIIKTNTNTWK
jgi:sugar O-acyltransferase (sialic acid O-acetyltransferase NeuD family)